MHRRELLKKDLFGEIWLQHVGQRREILRSIESARWWVRPIAKLLLHREARVLTALNDLHGVPQLLSVSETSLTRSYLDGFPLYSAKTPDREYFIAAFHLLRAIHRNSVAHNDLAKEPNLLVTRNGQPALLDFQLASISPSRGKLFRIAAREDLRHLMKHKRTYAPDSLTASQRALLDSPSWPTRVFRIGIKPVYLFITRRLLNWADREGAGDRGRR